MELLAMAAKLVGARVLSPAFKGVAVLPSDKALAKAKPKSTSMLAADPMSVAPKSKGACSAADFLPRPSKLLVIKLAQVVLCSLPVNLESWRVMASQAGTKRMRMASKGPSSGGASLKVGMALGLASGASPPKALVCGKLCNTAVAPALSNSWFRSAT